MQALSQASEHAIRALTFLAQRHGEDFYLSREMAEELELPAPFLSKLLVTLVGRGLLESRRGRGGGFRLTQPPGKIKLARIVEPFEDPAKLERCALGQEVCTDERACPLHDTWKRASQNWRKRLERTTLREVVRFCESRPGSRYPTTG